MTTKAKGDNAIRSSNPNTQDQGSYAFFFPVRDFELDVLILRQGTERDFCSSENSACRRLTSTVI